MLQGFYKNKYLFINNEEEMKELEKYFVITTFEDGWGFNEYAYEDIEEDWYSNLLKLDKDGVATKYFEGSLDV